MGADACRVLLVTPGNIGDTVLCLPVVAFLYSECKGSVIHVLTSPAACEVFRSDDRVGKLIRYEKRSGTGEKLSMVKVLMQERYSRIVDLRNTILPVLLGFRFWGRFFLRQAKFAADSRDSVHKKDHYLKIAAVFLGKDRADGEFRFGTNRDDERAAASFLEECGIHGKDTLVAVAPGGRTSLKRYAAPGYAEICVALRDAGAKVVLVGDRDDVPVQNEIIGRVTGISGLAGKTSLAQLAAVFKKCALVIANDSAPMHVASAAGVPVVGLFGPTDPSKYGPVARGSSVVRSGLGCSPCGSADCRIEPGTRCPPCMHNIRTREVVDVVRLKLGKKNRGIQD